MSREYGIFKAHKSWHDPVCMSEREAVMKLADVAKIIAELEARYKETESVSHEAESKASSLRTRLSHDKKVLDTWKAHAAALKDVGEFH